MKARQRLIMKKILPEIILLEPIFKIQENQLFLL